MPATQVAWVRWRRFTSSCPTGQTCLAIQVFTLIFATPTIAFPSINCVVQSPHINTKSIWRRIISILKWTTRLCGLFFNEILWGKWKKKSSQSSKRVHAHRLPTLNFRYHTGLCSHFTTSCRSAVLESQPNNRRTLMRFQADPFVNMRNINRCLPFNSFHLELRNRRSIIFPFNSQEWPWMLHFSFMGNYKKHFGKNVTSWGSGGGERVQLY